MPLTKRHLLALGGTAAVLAGAALLIPGGDEAPPGDASPLAFPALGTRLDAAARIEIRQGSNTLTLRREPDGRWVLPQKAGYPARAERVRDLLLGLSELRLAERRTADADALARLGLDDPGPNSSAVLLRVLDAADAPVAELIVGRRRTRTQGGAPGGEDAAQSAYVRRPGEPQSWLAEGRLSADADANLWIEREIANLPEERVLRVIGLRDNRTVELLREQGPDENGNAPLRIVLPGGAPPADEVSLDEVARAFEGLTLLDVRAADQAPGTPAGEGRFTLTDNLTILARIRQDGGDIWLTLAASGDEEAARLNARWRGWAYQVGTWKLPAFAPSLESLRKRDAAAPAPAPAAAAPSPAVPPATRPPVPRP